MTYTDILLTAYGRSTLMRSKLTSEVLSVAGFTSPKVKHLMNNLGNMCRTYLEVGAYHGATLTATCYGNAIEAVAVENFSEFRGKEQILRANMAKYCPSARLLVGDAFSDRTFQEIYHGVDLYLYDGSHSADCHTRALTLFESAFEDEIIYICDDWDWTAVREGTWRGLQSISFSIEHHMEVFPRVPEDVEGYWNGLGLFVLRRRSGFRHTIS